MIVVAEIAIAKYMLTRGMLDIDLWIGPLVLITYLYGFWWGALAANIMIWSAYFIRPDDTIPTLIASISAMAFCWLIAGFWGPGIALTTIVAGTVAYEIVLNTLCYPFDLDFLGRANTAMASSFIAWLIYTKIAIGILV